MAAVINGDALRSSIEVERAPERANTFTCGNARPFGLLNKFEEKQNKSDRSTGRRLDRDVDGHQGDAH